MFEKIKEWYRLGVWNEAKVRAATKKGAITPEQFKEITGKNY